MGLVASAVLLSACVGPSPAEHRAHDEVSQVGRRLSLPGRSAAESSLNRERDLADSIREAVLSHPDVIASYEEWHASAAMIGPARSLPDPRLTFEADIARTLMTFMPGVMVDLMASKTREAMAAEATAQSRVAYRTYVATVLRVASSVRSAWTDLAFTEETLRLKERSLAAVSEASELAQADYATGRGMATLEGPVTWASEAGRVASEIASLHASLTASRAAFKAALGRLPSDPDPVWPHPALEASALPSEAVLWAQIERSNASLAQMRSMVDMAVASVEVSRQAGSPDVSVGAMMDFKASPLLVRPLATLSLPIWRDRIEAVIEASGARRDAASARVRSETVAMAARMAQMLAMVRQADQMIAFIDHTALPGTERTLATTEAGYQTGMSGLITIPQAELMANGMLLERARALKEREDAVTGLLLMASQPAAELQALVGIGEPRAPDPL